MKHLWRPKSKSRVCSNHFSENIQDYSTLNLGYNAKSKVKLLIPAVAGSKRSLTYTSSITNNSGQSISVNTKHGHQNRIMQIYVVVVVQNLFLTPLRTYF